MPAIEELNYATAEVPVPKIKYVQVFQNEGGQSVTIQPASAVMSTFYIAQPAFYLDKTYLQFAFIPPVSGATVHANWVSAQGVPYISRFRGYFETTGTPLWDIQDFNKYMDATVRRNTSIDNVNTCDKLTSYGGATPDLVSQFEVLTNCNNSLTANGATKRHDNTNVRTVLTEPSYLVVGADASATPVINCMLRFDYFKDTIGELKQLFFTGGQDLVIEVYWSNLPNIMWTTDSLTDPTHGPAAANPGNGAITNLRLMVATESDSEILAWAANKYNTEGFKYNFRTVIASKGPSSTSTQHQVDACATSGYGKRLLKVHWVPYNQAEATNTIYDHDNRLGNKIAQYQTYIDNKLIPNGWYAIGNGVAYSL